MCKNCSKTKILIVIFLLTGAGLGIYFFAPWEDVVDKVKEKAEDLLPPKPSPTSPKTTPSPTVSPAPTAAPYSFMQCPKEGQCCNGLETNCDLRVNELMYATLHNANHDDDPIPNHKEEFEEALKVGYRGLNFDLCRCGGELVFCHAFCGIGARNVTEAFTNINSFLNDNPSEVIMLNIEMSVDNPSPLDLWDHIKGIDGISDKTYNHENKEWPTMGSMVKDGKQLVIFQHRGPICIDAKTAGCVPQVLSLFQFTLETEYSFKSVEEVEDVDKSCIRDRGVDKNPDFYAVNNFVTEDFPKGPNKEAAKMLNSMSFLTKRIEQCEAKTSLKTNFVNIDFWQVGDLPRFVQEQNKARAGVNRRQLKNTRSTGTKAFLR